MFLRGLTAITDRFLITFTPSKVHYHALLRYLYAMFSYDTVTEAVKGLKQRGFTTDFNLKENCIICHSEKFNPEEFKIMEFYRFEGNSDPSDEAIVYAIESKNGMKGVLVNGYGISSDALSDEMARKLRVHHQ